jgi:hypothetical protein
MLIDLGCMVQQRTYMIFSKLFPLLLSNELKQQDDLMKLICAEEFMSVWSIDMKSICVDGYHSDYSLRLP